MNILIITHRFFPNGDATSCVIQNFASGLMEKGHRIHVLAVVNQKEYRGSFKKSDVSITNIYRPGFESRKDLIAEIKQLRLGAIIKTIIKINAWFSNSAFPWNYRYSINSIYYKSIKKVLACLIKKRKFDVIISTLMPIDAVKAALKTKKNNIPVVIYQLDTYWNNDTLPNKYQKYRMDYEKIINRDCFFNMTTPQIIERNQSANLNVTKKQIAVEFPMVTEDNYARNYIFEGTNVHSIFCGRLYADIRPPEKIINVLNLVHDENQIFDFYGDGQELITSLKGYKKTNKRIVLHGKVTIDEATEARLKADFLINIDNTCTQQVPSKIFEYISSGKPIINFYFSEESDTLKYLSRYPSVLNINVNYIKPDEAARKVEVFINEFKGQLISFAEIKNEYKKNTPEYVANQFIKAYDIYLSRKLKLKCK